MKKIFYFLIFIICFFITNVRALEVDIYSENMVLYNLNEDFVIAEKNKDEKTSIASMTKIMTVLVAIQNIDDLNEKIVLTKDVFYGLKEANASVAGFYVGQTVTYEDLLYGAFLPSGADATNALAINLTGSIDNFVKLMNEEAQKLNLKNTHFSNTTGLDDENHYSTVDDVATILKEALKNETFKEIFTNDRYLISDKSITFTSTLGSSLKVYDIRADYIIGGKTGYTFDAGRCLASIAYDEKNDIYYLLVTSKAPITTRYYHLLDAKNIYDYYFDNYKYFDLIKKDDIISKIKVKYSKEKEIDLLSPNTIKKYLKNDFDIEKLEINYIGKEIINYNTKIGEKLGTVYINYNGEELDSFDLFLTMQLHFSLFEFIKEHFIIILSVVLIIILVFVKIKKRKKKKKRTRF